MCGHVYKKPAITSKWTTCIWPRNVPRRKMCPGTFCVDTKCADWYEMCPLATKCTYCTNCAHISCMSVHISCRCKMCPTVCEVHYVWNIFFINWSEIFLNIIPKQVIIFLIPIIQHNHKFTSYVTFLNGICVAIDDKASKDDNQTMI